MDQDLVLIQTHRAEDVLPEADLPAVEQGEPIILSSDPDGPFRMLARTEDWEAMMESAPEPTEDAE